MTSRSRSGGLRAGNYAADAVDWAFDVIDWAETAVLYAIDARVMADSKASSQLPS